MEAVVSPTPRVQLDILEIQRQRRAINVLQEHTGQVRPEHLHLLHVPRVQVLKPIPLQDLHYLVRVFVQMWVFIQVRQTRVYQGLPIVRQGLMEIQIIIHVLHVHRGNID